MAKKVVFRALEKTIFISACIHLFFIFVEAVRTGNFTILHMASILDLNFFFPIEYTWTTAVLSCLPIVLIFVYFLLREKKSPEK